MWTPKRVLILIGGFVLFMSCYVVYAYFLDGINGLPPLPQEYAQDESREGHQPRPEETSEASRRLEMSFGPGSEELSRPIQIWLRDKGIALAAGQFDIEPDGRVKLSPFSVALFPKNKREGFPEINTVQSEFCYLTLDRPVASLTELANRKVYAVELRGKRGVTMINNRRSREKNDDLEILIRGAPLYYEETRNVIWTEGYVQLLDMQSQPEPIKIQGKGLDLKLSKEVAPNRPRPTTPEPAKKESGVGGVEMITLRSNVEMLLFIDANSTFLSDQKDKPAATPPGKTEKAKIAIKTNGPFNYDLVKEIACYDAPPPSVNSTPLSPEHVVVTRENKLPTGASYDQITCDHLELKFHRKDENSTEPRNSQTGDKEIESAYASARPGKEVVLALDTQRLEAYGNELWYHANQGKRSPKTILKGNPMHAVNQDGSKISARELILYSLEKNKVGQQVAAIGPGQIDMMDKGKQQGEWPIHIMWKDMLTSFKEREEDQFFDHLTLTGDAAFIDDEHNQRLEGQRLQVWLKDAQTGATAPQGQSTGMSKQKLHKVLAEGNVIAKTAEMNVKRSNRLMITFIPEAAVEDQLPPVAMLPATPAQTVSNRAKDNEPAPTPALPPVPALGAPVVGQVALPEPEKKKANKPIEMEGDDIVLYVSTQGTKNQLQEMKSEGSVFVLQEGDKPGENKVKIIGKTLNLVHHPLGDILYVYGESNKYAYLELGELKLWGPKVVIDQKENVATVDGQGVMKLPSNAALDGTKTAPRHEPLKTEKTLTIHWSKNMNFRGKDANFYGGVQVTQDETSKMLCQDLSITLDRFVSLKEGQKDGKGAKVDRLIADQRVFAQDDTIEAGKIVQRNVIEGTTLELDNMDGPFKVLGPLGRVRSLAYSSGDTSLAPGQPKAKSENGEKRLMLTRVEFTGWMLATSKTASKRAKFVDNIHVYYFPAHSLDAVMNPDQPPKDGIYLNCAELEVASREVNGKQAQLMIAKINVFFRTDEYFGTADVVKFDESQDTIILEATGNNVVRLSKRIAAGQQPETTTGRKFLYNRRTGQFTGDSIKNLQSSQLNPQKSRDEVLRITGLNVFRVSENLNSELVLSEDERCRLRRF